MAIDIVPDLLDNIQRDFNTAIKSNKKIQKIQVMIENGTATYRQANEYAVEVGDALARTFKVHIKSETLPDGKMYYNIAERVLSPTLNNNHAIVARVSAEIQENLNRSVGLGLKGIKPPVNQLRIDSIINRVVAEEVFDDAAWILQEPIINFTQSIVDDAIKTNVEFQGESGLSPRIIRTSHGNPPCDWCRSMQGVYKYPDVPADVYRRHDRCRCTVEYDPSDVRRQNIWTKEWSG
ncbi:hypothetical protein [Sporosarcina sp. 6E9]|uniref:hypothetical protein n=1 Tax=Sporosarcina sp. 6E9 TaxID=2819235 RepID=UPI001AC47837|nr:hypothetical protein [Sporosarcina sp. 6E9]MBO1909666.1 hypothetical protein [Microvirga sp. 3-52]